MSVHHARVSMNALASRPRARARGERTGTMSNRSRALIGSSLLVMMWLMFGRTKPMLMQLPPSPAAPNLDESHSAPYVRIDVGTPDRSADASLPDSLPDYSAFAADNAAPLMFGGASTATQLSMQAEDAERSSPQPRLRAPSVISLYSAWLDRFIRVEDDGSLHADVEYPWADRSWFTVVRLSHNFSIADPNDFGWLGESHGSKGRHTSGRRLLQQGHSAQPYVGAPRAGATDAALARAIEEEQPQEGGRGGGGRGGGGGGGVDDLGAAQDAEERSAELSDELWQGEELGGSWFALASVATGKLLQLHTGHDADSSLHWVVAADVAPPTPKQLALAAASAASFGLGNNDADGEPSSAKSDASEPATTHGAQKGKVGHRAAVRKAKKGPWIAPPGAAWRVDGDRLRNRASGGVLNVRSGGLLRGHGNVGPPWRVAEGMADELSSVVALRSVPRQLQEAAGWRNGGGGGGGGGRGGHHQGRWSGGVGGGGPLPPHKRYSFLSVDYHIATAQDVGHTLRELGQTFVEKSLSGACGRRHTCASPHELPSLSRDHAFTLCPRPHATRRAAFEALRQSPLITQADGVVCSHPAALCELWLPFNKSILLIVTANLELARENAERWKAWLQTVVALARSDRAVVAANNRYDQAYVEHFTGIRPLYLPTLANYITARYRPIPSKPVLLARSHHAIGRKLLVDLKSAAHRQSPPLRVASVEEYYPGNAGGGGYEYSQLASHPAIVVVPYTKSTMTFFELYRIGIPIFVPSIRLLNRWELQRHVMSERVYWRHAPSPLRMPSSPNPNSLTDQAALEHWLKLSDPYVYPHVQFFDSAEDLAAKLTTTNLQAVSARMRRHSAEMQPVMRAKWKAVIRKLFHGKPSGSWPAGNAGGFDEALRSRFGMQLSNDEPDCSRLSAPELGQWN